MIQNQFCINELANKILIDNISIKDGKCENHEDVTKILKKQQHDRFSGEVDRQVVALLTEYCGFEVQKIQIFLPRGAVGGASRLRMFIIVTMVSFKNI